MQLSKRLLAVADMVSKGNRLVDVGTDHGYLPIYLVENKQVPSAIAMDINKGPIERAIDHIKEHDLEEYIKTRLSDGVTALCDDEGDTLVIAGMGGGLVIKIITNGSSRLENFKEFILQPQSEIEMVRKFLIKNDYYIIEENMILEEEKYYPMMKVVKGNMPSYDKTVFYKYGKALLENKNEILKLFLEKEFYTYTDILDKLSKNPIQKDGKRYQEIQTELEYIKEAFTYYEE